jgi:uroporphyrin-III C-methyltransferase / precorrin-2 dehydrogenase / sirohydrochlorin ferrochelatase
MGGLFPFLPVFVDLAGRAAVLLSGDAELVPIARRLLDAGAGVTVIDRVVAPAMAELAPSVRLVQRRWRPLDMSGAALVVAGAGEKRPGRARTAAKAAGAMFTMSGASERSEVIFGAAAAWGPVAIGVTASGLAPGLGEAMARRLEAAVPPSYAGFLAAAARLRGAIDRDLADQEKRDAFWRAAAAEAFDATPLEDGGWDAWLNARR